MAKLYVCANCGTTYDRMPIDWPEFCSVECGENFDRRARLVEAVRKFAKEAFANWNRYAEDAEREAFAGAIVSQIDVDKALAAADAVCRRLPIDPDGKIPFGVRG